MISKDYNSNRNDFTSDVLCKTCGKKIEDGQQCYDISGLERINIGYEDIYCSINCIPGVTYHLYKL